MFVGLLVVGWRLAARNSATLKVDFLVGTFADVPVWLTVLGAFGAGVAVMALVVGYQWMKLGMLTRRYRKTVSRLDAEIHQLRNLPLAIDEPVTEAHDAEERIAVSSQGAVGRGV